MENSFSGYVQSNTSNGITTIEFFHPQSNSLPGNLLTALAAEIDKCSEEENTKVIVLRSAGEKAFCAGASFDELIAIENKENGLAFFSGFAKVINAIRKNNKLVIARIHGKCVGGGVGIAAASDFAIASQKAEIKLSELAVGIGPFVIGPAVERKAGLAAFSQMAIDASTWFSAEWAKQKGLFAEVHDTTEEMDASINKLSNWLALSSADAMMELKKVFWQGTENWDDLLMERAAVSGRLVLSDFTKEFIKKFKASSSKK